MRGSLVLILFSSLDFQTLSSHTQKARSCFAPDDAKRQDSSLVLTASSLLFAPIMQVDRGA